MKETEEKVEVLQNCVTLNNGMKMPLCGFGSYKSNDVADLIYEVIKQGVRLIDTAYIYENEDKVGEGIEKALKQKLVTREELFVVTKIWTSHYSDPEKALLMQLKDLKLDYVDLYLIHWPLRLIDETTGGYERTPIHKLWFALEALVKKGLCKSIGVSNFNTQLVLDILTYCEIKPVINQIEFHPYLQQNDLVSFCKRNKIEVMAYNSLVKGVYVEEKLKNEYDLLKEGVVTELAKKYGKSEGQVVLNWAISKDIIVIPKTDKNVRISENFAAKDFRLSKEDVEKLDKLECNKRFNNVIMDKYGNANIFA